MGRKRTGKNKAQGDGAGADDAAPSVDGSATTLGGDGDELTTLTPEMAFAEAVDRLTEKRAAVRVESLRAVRAQLSKHAPECLDGRLDTTLSALFAVVRRRPAAEAALAADSLELVLLTLGPELADVYEQVLDTVRPLTAKSHSLHVRTAAVRLLGLAYFIAGEDVDEQEEIMDTLLANGCDASPVLGAASLEAWASLFTLCSSARQQKLIDRYLASFVQVIVGEDGEEEDETEPLAGDGLSLKQQRLVRKATNEVPLAQAIGVMLEAVWDVAEAEDDDAADVAEAEQANAGPAAAGRMATTPLERHVRARLDALGVDLDDFVACAKELSRRPQGKTGKRETSALRTDLRQVWDVASSGETGAEKIKIGKQTITLHAYEEQLRYNYIKASLSAAGDAAFHTFASESAFVRDVIGLDSDRAVHQVELSKVDKRLLRSQNSAVAKARTRVRARQRGVRNVAMM